MRSDMELLKAAIEAGWQARGLEVAVLELRAGKFSCALNRLIQRAQDNSSSRSARGDFQNFMGAAGQHHGGSEAKRHQR